MLSTARPAISLAATTSLVATACFVTLTGLAGCAQPTAEERVAAVRAQTKVELLSFAVREEPVVAPVLEPVAEEAAAAEPGPAGNAGAQAAAGDEPDEAIPNEEIPNKEIADEETADAGDVPVTADVLLDLLVSCAADQPLAGITVEFEQVDASQNVKDSRRLWVPTPNLVRAVGAQFSVTVEDVDYVEGDGFSVTVRSAVPETERSEYPEFQSLGES